MPEISRRSFLKTTALASVMPLVASENKPSTVPPLLAYYIVKSIREAIQPILTPKIQNKVIAQQTEIATTPHLLFVN